MELFRRTVADINIENLIHNWQQIKSAAADDRFICPMVKANAYGHGAPEVSLALESEGARALGVCLIEEGLQLRAEGVHAEILVFRGFDKRGAEKILEYQMTPVASTWAQVYALEAAADEPVKVHLKFNTGMNRLGFAADQADELASYFKKTKKLKLKAICSHLVSSDAQQILRQLQSLSEISEHFSGFDIFNHVLNSGGIADHVLHPDPKKQWGFRPGLMLYGYNANPSVKALDLRPVMSLKSVINNIQEVKAGETVSYGGTWKASRPSRVAVIPIGYADGVHRILSNNAEVLIKGKRVPLIGTVCMDFIMADITDIIGVEDSHKWVEEDVLLFGADDQQQFISADEVAARAKTISWEVLTSVSGRVPRHFKGIKQHD